MSLKDTSASLAAVTSDEIAAALRWAIQQADHESARVIRRSSGLDRQTAKRLEIMYRDYRRALSVLAAPVSPDSDLLKEAVGVLEKIAAHKPFGDLLADRPDRRTDYQMGHDAAGSYAAGLARAFLSKLEERGHD